MEPSKQAETRVEVRLYGHISNEEKDSLDDAETEDQEPVMHMIPATEPQTPPDISPIVESIPPRQAISLPVSPRAPHTQFQVPQPFPINHHMLLDQYFGTPINAMVFMNRQIGQMMIPPQNPYFIPTPPQMGMLTPPQMGMHTQSITSGDLMRMQQGAMRRSRMTDSSTVSASSLEKDEEEAAAALWKIGSQLPRQMPAHPLGAIGPYPGLARLPISSPSPPSLRIQPSPPINSTDLVLDDSRGRGKSKGSGQSRRLARVWTQPEDMMLADAISKHGENWRYISQAIFIGTRSSADCSQHWRRVLSPSIRRGGWSEAEDEALANAVAQLGERAWSKVATNITGRTDIQCRYRWLHMKKVTKDSCKRTRRDDVDEDKETKRVK